MFRFYLGRPFIANSSTFLRNSSMAFDASKSNFFTIEKGLIRGSFFKWKVFNSLDFNSFCTVNRDNKAMPSPAITASFTPWILVKIKVYFMFNSRLLRSLSEYVRVPDPCSLSTHVWFWSILPSMRSICESG